MVVPQVAQLCQNPILTPGVLAQPNFDSSTTAQNHARRVLAWHKFGTNVPKRARRVLARLYSVVDARKRVVPKPKRGIRARAQRGNPMKVQAIQALRSSSPGQEQALLHRSFERFCNMAAPWELQPHELVARECMANWYTYALAALDDAELGPRLTDDVAGLEPAAALRRYVSMYAEDWAAWLEFQAAALAAEDQRLATGKLSSVFGELRVIAASRNSQLKPGQTFTGVVAPPDRRLRLAWRMWQMQVASKDRLGEREIEQMFGAYFDALGGEECRKLSKLLL